MNTLFETAAPTEVATQAHNYPFGQHVKDLFQKYTKSLNGDSPQEVYKLFLGEFEKPFLEGILSYTRHNQSKAAIMLGISRGTLRKKLKEYDLI